MNILSSEQGIVLSVNIIALVTSLFIVLSEGVSRISKRDSSKLRAAIVFFITIVVSLVIGLRDETVGIDTASYAYMFREGQATRSVFVTGDIGWNAFVYLFSSLTSNVSIFFVFNAIVYTAAPFIGLKNKLGYNLCLLLALTLLSPNFVQFGINVMRQGFAASIFLFALKYYDTDKKILMYTLMGLSVAAHMSMIAPFVGLLIITMRGTIKKSHALGLILIWTLLLLFTIAGLNNWADYFPFLGGRLLDYSAGTSGVEAKIFNVPVNFWRYSALPVVLYLFFLIKGTKIDRFYTNIGSVYVLCSCVYILTFSFSYSLRFAYLSEFLMPLLIVYPIVTFRPFKKSSLMLSVLITLLAIAKVVTTLS